MTTQKKKKKIGKILMEMGYVTPIEVKEALTQQKEDGGRLGEILVKLNYAKPEQVAKGLAKQYRLPYVNLTKYEIPTKVIECVPSNVASDYGIIPVKRKKRRIIVACSDPLDFFTLDDLRFRLGCEIDMVLASKQAISDSIVKYYGEESAIDDLIDEMTSSAIQIKSDNLEDLAVEEEDDAPVIRLVNMIIAEAIKQRASDIHVEPFEEELRVRYRIDGVCVPQENPPKKLQGSIITRLKIMAKMDPAEKRAPQDGRIKMNIAGREIDFRVNSLPARHGESVVLRVLDKEKALVDLTELGFDKYDLDRFHKIINRPNGVFLVTGPTGSGKTTTLYAAMKKLNRPDKKIITAENPVEYNLTGINQSQVNHRIGLTFARILKAMLRQAPNVILVGEIRDQETAETAIQAALTGHLVFSTLHTNDAPSSFNRLIDMDVKPFLVASAVLAVLAQRLVRRLCKECREPYTPRPSMMRAVNLSQEQLQGRQVYRPNGCPECGHKGYTGRMGIYELLEMNSELRDLVFADESSEEIRRAAIANGMTTLQMDGVRKVLSGFTSVEEVLRLTHRADMDLEDEDDDFEEFDDDDDEDF